MSGVFKVPLELQPQPGGGYTVTSPALPELVTEGDTLEEALENVKDALAAVIEIYEDLGRVLPESVGQPPPDRAVRFEALVTPP